MKRSLLVAALLVLGCSSKPNPQPEPSPNPATAPAPQPATPQEPAPGAPSVDGWPARPAAVVLEARIEGVMPTLGAILTQARKVSEIPPVEGMLPASAAGAAGLSDPSVLRLEAPAGLLLVDLPQNPSPVVYFGISDAAAFQKALPPGPTLDAKGNALAITPPPDLGVALGGGPLYLNFQDGYVVLSPTAEAYGKVKEHLTAVFKMPVTAPTLWLDIEVGTLWKNYGLILGSLLDNASRSMPPTPGIDMKAFFGGFTNLVSQIDELELRYTPVGDTLLFTSYVSANPGSALEKRFAVPNPEKLALLEKLPVGAFSGAMYVSPEFSQDLVSWYKTAMPEMGALVDSMGSFMEQATGEYAMTSGNTLAGSVFLVAVKDSEATKAALRKTFAAENSSAVAGGPSTKLSPIEVDAEEIAGVKVDRLRSSIDFSSADPAVEEQMKAMGLGNSTIRYAYLPGLLLGASGDAALPLLERIIKGEPGDFLSSLEVQAATRALPQARASVFFFSLPQLIRSLGPGLPLQLPEEMNIKSGAAASIAEEKGRLRLDLAVPVSHILDVKVMITATIEKEKAATP